MDVEEDQANSAIGSSSSSNNNAPVIQTSDIGTSNLTRRHHHQSQQASSFSPSSTFASTQSSKSQSTSTNSNSNSNQENEMNICRICRSEAAPDRPLFYPCVCTGSIKYIHQECLVQWLKYSKKEYCELCKHKFSFAPIYHPDMPTRLPARDILTGLLKNIFKAIKFWLHSTLVAISWLAIVPLTACRIYRCLFAGSVSSLLTLPLDMLSTDNIISDILQGGFVVLCSLGAFISLVWLREQILSGGGPDWLEVNNPAPAQPQNPAVHRLNNGNNVNNQRPLNRNRNQPQNQILQNDNQNEEIQNNNNNNNNNPNINPIDENANDPFVDNHLNEPEVDPVNVNPEEQQQQQQPEIPPNQQPQQQQAAANEDNHWNPMEWDRAAEDLTWDRLLGLDGSLLFLEHVFWVISLNTLFILVFAFCPYHLGHYMIYGLKLQEIVDKTHFEGLITTLVGYILLAMILVLLYISMSVSSFYRARKVIGLCYIVIKVALLVVFEICVFPLITGIWLDICSLKLFNSTLNDRLNGFEQSPGTSVFIHWLVGMIYIFYFATFVFLLREVLRPGMLWFLRNLNDPEFNPVQEMIQLPVFRHIRRFLTSVLLFGFSIVLLLLVPIKLINYFSLQTNNKLLPYNVSNSNETLASELSVELLWLHAALPALLEQSHIRIWTKNFLKLWVFCVAWLLGIRSFLLGDEKNNSKNSTTNNNQNNNENNQNGIVQQQQVNQNPFQFNIGIAHQAMLQNNTPFVNESYTKPSHFKLRVFAFIVIMCFSLIISSLVTLIVPVTLGRFVLYMLTDNTKLNELYTIVTGLYTIWLTIRLTTIIYNWIQMGLYQLYLKFKQKITVVVKSSTAVLMIFGFLPILFGLLFQQIIINPISANHDQTPVMSLWQIWALGLLHTKIATALILAGPQWWLRQAVDRVFQDGFRNIDLKFMFLKVVYPITICLGLALSIPCILSRSIAPLFISNPDYLILIDRRIYPVSLFIFSFVVLLVFQMRQFKRLYERIRNDKYLVGKRLINFERNLASKTSNSTATNVNTEQ